MSDLVVEIEDGLMAELERWAEEEGCTVDDLAKRILTEALAKE
jgi:hypothetical protein